MLIVPYDDHLAMQVFERLDPWDLLEAQVMRGCNASHLQLFAEWRGAATGAIFSYVLRDVQRPGQPPFAVVNLCHTGQYGVAQAAMLARNHKTFRRPLMIAARMIRALIREEAAAMGIRRIEARSWAGHPSAARLLGWCGFTCEAAAMPGFGEHGGETCQLFAWTIQT